MSGNTLKKMKTYLIKNKIIDSKLIDSFINFIKDYNINEYIYIEAVENSTLLNNKEAYRTLSNITSDLGFFKIKYKVFCPSCFNVTDDFFDSLNEVNEYSICENCENTINETKNPYKYIILAYQVAIDYE